MFPGPSAHSQNGACILYNLFPPSKDYSVRKHFIPIFSPFIFSHPLCDTYFIHPDIYFTLAVHNHTFIGDTDDTVTTLAVGNLALLTADPFLATVRLAVQVEVSSLGDVGTQIVSVIKFGSLCLGTLSPQFNAHYSEKKTSFYGMCNTFCHKWRLFPFIQIDLQLMCYFSPTIHPRSTLYLNIEFI